MLRMKRDTLLGLVFFGGLGLLMWATVQLSDISFQQKQHLRVFFEDASGLRKGDPIFVLGHRQGQVLEVAWVAERREHRIRVEMELKQPVTLREDALLEIRDANFLGGKEVDIDPGTSERGLPPEHVLIGITRPNAFDSLSRALGEADIGGAIKSVRRFFEQMSDPQGSIGALISRKDAYDELMQTMGSLRRSMEEIEKGRGPVHELIYNADMGSDLTKAFSEMRLATEKMNRGNGVVARLLGDAELAGNLSDTIANLRAITDTARTGAGLIPRLLNSGPLANDVADMASSLRSVAAKMNDPKAGFVGALLGDTKMLADGRSALSNINEITAKVNDPEGKGLLAKLINDPELGEQLDRLFGQVTRAIEDAREAAPVGTFFQILGGPF